MPLILIPAVISLTITLLRLAGELLKWSPVFFSRAAGGGFSLVGISWLIPVFAVYFALVLSARGEGPASGWKAAGWGLVAILVNMGFMGLGNFLHLSFEAFFLTIAVGSWISIAIAFWGWPRLARTLVGYGLAVRIPVAIVMLFAIYGRWGTHYDVSPPNRPQIDALAPMVKWLMIGLMPQLTIWMYLTVAGGMFVGGLAAAIAGRRKA